MYLAVGLGNPGIKYAGTRHNLGFDCIDLAADACGARLVPSQCRAVVGRAKIKDEWLVFAKPRTFMNLSGEAVECLVREMDLEIEQILVICDDLNLPLGRFRFRPAGGDGGHQGIASIIQCLGTDRFARLRIGVGRGCAPGEEADYVLERFTEDERAHLASIADQVPEMIKLWTTAGVQQAMNHYNGLDV